MKYFLASLVAVKSLIFMEIEAKININSVKRSGEDEIGTIILETDIYDAF